MIAGVRGREVLDSRGRPTVEAELELNDGTTVIASVPSGASRGRHEAVERRDGDPSRYGGRGVRGAVAAIEGEIAEFLTGREPDQRAIDGTLIELDGTRDKSRLGANAILAVSLAVARAATPLATGSRCGAALPAGSRSRCRCRWSTSSAVGCMPDGSSTSRTSSQSLRVPARIRRRSNGWCGSMPPPAGCSPSAG